MPVTAVAPPHASQPPGEWRIVIEPDGDAFHAFVPALKGLHVDGASRVAALRALGDALALYADSMIKHGDTLRTPKILDARTRMGIPSDSLTASENELDRLCVCGHAFAAHNLDRGGRTWEGCYECQCDDFKIALARPPRGDAQP